METNFKLDSFKSIRNYIHNYLALTKPEVRSIVDEQVKQIVKEEVTKYFNDEERLKSMIEKEIVRQLRYAKEVDQERRSFIISTMDAIYNKIDQTIHEEVCNRLIIKLKEEEDGEEVWGLYEST